MGGDHKCPVCQATFTRPQHVARHMRSHTGDRPYKCQHCGDQFARSDLLSRHINKCHADEKPLVSPGSRRKGSSSASRATTSRQACDQCVQSSLPCDGANPCAKCIQRKCRCTYVKFHRQTAPIGPGHQPRQSYPPPARIPPPAASDILYLHPPPPAPIPSLPDPASTYALYPDWVTAPWTHDTPGTYSHNYVSQPPDLLPLNNPPSFFPPQPQLGDPLVSALPADDPDATPMPLKDPRDAQLWKQYMRSPDQPNSNSNIIMNNNNNNNKRTRVLSMPVRGESSVRTTLSEDLSSYEAAVLARKAPTNLNLVPKHRRGTLPTPSPFNAHQYPFVPYISFDNPNSSSRSRSPVDHSSSSSSSLAGVFGHNNSSFHPQPLTPSSSFHLRQGSPSASSTGTTVGSSSRASSVATDQADDGYDDHSSPHDSIPEDDTKQIADPLRPTVKRLASTHLGSSQFLIPDQDVDNLSAGGGGRMMMPSPVDPFAFGMN